MKTRKRLGFTIVELVIVIAVIAILAAILIPTFSGVIQKANESSDTQLIRNLNTAIAPEKALQKNGLPTAYSAFAVANENGYGVERIVEKSGYNIAYDVNKQQFILLDMAENKYLFPIDAENNEIKTLTDVQEKLDIFVVSIDDKAMADAMKAGYSIYWANAEAPANTTVTVGFDAGECEKISVLTYERPADAEEQNAVVRTNTFDTKLVVNAPTDTVRHFSYAAIVDVQAIKSSSYDEYGTVGRLEVKSGHVEVMEDSEVFCLMDARDETEKQEVPTTVNEGANVHTEMYVIAGDEDVVKDSNGVGSAHIHDCGAGNHNFSMIIFDGKHYYDVCERCGYTLISIKGSDDVVYKQSKNTVVNGEVVENVTPVKTVTVDFDIANMEALITAGRKDASGNIIIDGNAIESDDYQSQLTGGDDPDCKHKQGFVETILYQPTCTQEGMKQLECPDCHAKSNALLPKTAHQYYDNIGNLFTPDEKCAVCGHVRGEDVVKIGNKIYKTLEDAIKDAPTDGTLTKIVMIADDAAVLTKDGMWAAWHIKAGQNIELDLAGYTLKDLIKFPAEYFDGDSNNGEFDTPSANNGVFHVAEGAKLTVKDSSCKLSSTDGTGKIYNQLSKETPETLWTSAEYRQGYVNREDDVILSFGEFVLESGTLDCQAPGSICFAIDAQGTSTTTVNGGIVQNTGVAIRVYHVGAKSFTVNDGIIKGGCGFSFHDTKNNTNIVINGGEFITKGGTYYKATSNEGFIITINGGTFSDNVTAACKEGYFARKGADGRYSLALISDARDDEITATIGDDKYLSFEKAFDSVRNGETIKLFKDVALDDDLIINIDTNITIDMNGRKLYANYTGTSFIRSESGSGSVLFKNGTIDFVSTSSIQSTGVQFYLDNVILTEGTRIYCGAGYIPALYIGGTYSYHIVPKSVLIIGAYYTPYNELNLSNGKYYQYSDFSGLTDAELLRIAKLNGCDSYELANEKFRAYSAGYYYYNLCSSKVNSEFYSKYTFTYDSQYCFNFIAEEHPSYVDEMNIPEGYCFVENGDMTVSVVKAKYIVQYQNSNYYNYVWGSYNTKSEADEQLEYFDENYGEGTEYNFPYYETVRAKYAVVYTDGIDYVDWYFDNKSDADQWVAGYSAEQIKNYNVRVIEWAIED